jgi:hypothetical protein
MEHCIEASCFTYIVTSTQLQYITAFIFFWCYSPNLDLGLPPWNSPFHFRLLELRHSVELLGRVISSSQGLYLYINTEKRKHIHKALSRIRTHDPVFQASEYSACLRPLGYRDRHIMAQYTFINWFMFRPWRQLVYSLLLAAKSGAREVGAGYNWDMWTCRG